MILDSFLPFLDFAVIGLMYMAYPDVFRLL